MRNTLAGLFSLAAMTTLAAVQEPAPTREWVRQYCATACVARTAAAIASTTPVESSNGVKRLSIADGTNTFNLVWEDATVHALRASACNPVAVSGGFTNGMLFVWREAVTGYVNHATTIYATKTGLHSGAFASVTGDDRITHMRSGSGGDFTVFSVLLQPSIAREIIGD